MALKAREVLADCRNALDLLQEETPPEVSEACGKSRNR